MKKILIIRTSSLGDLIHVLPAISDIARHFPDAQLDWVVEESLVEIPKWHPFVDNIIPVAHRRWRKSWFSAQTRKERKILKEQLQASQYDAIIDLQGLLKSIWIARQAKGVRHGADWKSVREPLASLFYDVKHTVEFWQPVVDKRRKLTALSLAYAFEPEKLDFGMQKFTDGIEIQPWAAIMPSASRDDKLWAPENWAVIFDYLTEKGLQLRVYAGNDAERSRAQALIENYPNAQLMPKMTLTEIAHTLAPVQIMVGLDTGLTHMAAALGRPTVGIYTASSPSRAPVQSTGFSASLGDRGVPPSHEVVLAKVRQVFEA